MCTLVIARSVEDDAVVVVDRVVMERTAVLATLLLDDAAASLPALVVRVVRDDAMDFTSDRIVCCDCAAVVERVMGLDVDA